MTVREEIQATIANLSDDGLEEVLQLLKGYVASNNGEKKPGILSRLKKIKIQGPPDFAENFDAYMSGEKRVDQDIP